MSKTPDQVSEYVRAAVDFVQRAVGMVLDGSDESLAVLDHYVAQVPRDQPEIVGLVTPAVGAYFGEVVRRRFGGEWRLDGEPTAWRLSLEGGAVTFAPVGMAAAAVYRAEVEGFDAEMTLAPAHREDIEAGLELAAPVTEEYYYSLTGRFETIQHVLDLLAGLRARARRADDEQN
ncbi:MAG: hypothetical protein HY906_02265 [Deltaproteobacteria bacterium]|nr:hypothetical protein [Deltaproteobacteria bacterium]